MSDLAYFSGQGKVFIAPRIAGGAICGPFKFAGDCDALTVNTSQKYDDVEESQTGLRLTAAHIPIGTTLAMKLNALQWSADNLAIATFGEASGTVAAGTVTAEDVIMYADGLAPLQHPGVSSVVGKLAGVTGTIASVCITAAGSGYTPNSKLELTIAGSPGTGAKAYGYTDASGKFVSAWVESAGTGYAAPAATVKTPGSGTGATFAVNMGATTLTLDTDYTLNADYGSVTALPGSTKIPVLPSRSVEPTVTPLHTEWAYAYNAYTGRVEAFTKTVSDYAFRFEGLNMADGGTPVIVTIHRVTLEIAKTLALIEAKHGNLEIGGMLLPDTSRPAGLSQYYTIVKA